MPSPAAEAFANAAAEQRDKENAVRQFRLHLVTVAVGALALSASLWSDPPPLALASWAVQLVSVVAGVLGMHWCTTHELAAQTRETLNVAGALPADPKRLPRPKGWHRTASQWSYRVQLPALLLGLLLLSVARLLNGQAS